MMATAFLGIEYTCPKWLDDEMGTLLMTSNLIISPRGRRWAAPAAGPKLKSLLDEHNIKPCLVFEELNKEEIKENLRTETRKKAGIYGIFNLTTNNFYVGSAVTNRFYSRFYKHLIKGLGNKNIAIDLEKYGIESFAFVILEYFPSPGAALPPLPDTPAALRAAGASSLIVLLLLSCPRASRAGKNRGPAELGPNSGFLCVNCPWLPLFKLPRAPRAVV
jgi:hypothetical protein